MVAKTAKLKETPGSIEGVVPAKSLLNNQAGQNAGEKPEPSELNAILAAGRQAYQVRDWTGLKQLVTDGLAKNPDNYELLLLKSRALTNLRDWAEAIPAWDAVCNVRPTWAEAWFQWARAFSRSGNRPGAARVAETLRALSETDPAALIFFVRIAFEIEDMPAAAASFKKLVESDRETAEREAANFERESDLRALLIATKTLRDASDDGAQDDERLQDMTEQLLRRAISRERAEHFADAYLDCAVLLGIYPDDSLAQKSLARVLRGLQQKADKALKEERFEDACDAYRELMRCTPKDIDRLTNYGRTLLRLKRPEEAIPVWQQMVAIAPDRREGYVQLARALDRASKFGLATKAWRDVIERDPENFEAQQALAAVSRRAVTAGRAAITEERFLDAWHIFDDLREEETEKEEVARRLDQIERNILKTIRTAYKQRNLREIFTYYRDIPGLLHNSAEGQLLLARALTELHRYDLAAKGWRRLAELDPLNNAKPYLQIARCYLRAGLPMEAGTAIAELRAREPENEEARKMQTDLREMLLTGGM
jgi:tetratricopeptide (TPR) repeat protein